MSAAEPSLASVSRFAVPARTTIRVHLNESVNLDNITKIVASLGTRYGCRTCGLLGFDLQLQGDPGDFREIEGIPGVQSVSLG